MINIVKKDGKYDVLKNNIKLYNYSFDEYVMFSDYYFVKYNGKWSILDKDGLFIKDHTYKCYISYGNHIYIFYKDTIAHVYYKSICLHSFEYNKYKYNINKDLVLILTLKKNHKYVIKHDLNKSIALFTKGKVINSNKMIESSTNISEYKVIDKIIE